MIQSVRFLPKKLLGGLALLCAVPGFAQTVDSARVGEMKEDVRSNIPVIVLDENDSENNTGSSGQSISSLLYGGRDPYFSGVFNFNAARFRIRGYDAAYFETYINGVPVRNLTNGYTPWALWGGLNDVMRSRVNTYGLRAVDFACGDIGGATDIDTRASQQRPQLSVSYANSNRNYNHRVMASWASGVLENGWAFSFAGSFRYADEGYLDGTFYNGYSYFASADKKIGKDHLLSFTTFGTPTTLGGQTAATKEMYELAGTHYYNSGWGYQNGEKRSANSTTTFQPYFIMNHDWTIDDKSKLSTAVAYSFGERYRTALDWYNAADPRPDYYRNLPSFAENQELKDYMTGLFKSDESLRQVNWANIYDINRNSFASFGADGATVTGTRARYILEDRVTNSQKLNFNSVYNDQFGKHVDFTAGIYYNVQRDHNFKRVNDLLGADFYINLNQFAERDFPNNTEVNQNDLDNPNRILGKDDRFGYDYNMNVNEARTFLQTVFRYNHIDFFLSGAYSSTEMWRDGNVRNGLFPNSSKGKSQTFTFVNYAAKGGITYKIDGRNYLYANGSYSTRAPYVESVFISPRNRNTAQDNVTSEKIVSTEAGYVLNADFLKIRLNGYYSKFSDGMDVLSYYDDSYQNFVNYSLSNIGREYYGGEFGVEAPLYKGLKINAAANVGRYYYTTRQNAVVTVDNSAAIIANEVVYSKNFRVGQTPQEAYTVGLNYQGRKNWFVNANYNYFDQMWVAFNPVRRTERALQGVEAGSAQWYSIINQERLPGQSTVDVFGGKNFSIRTGKTRATLVLTAGVNNLLNNKDLISGGFEQLRFDYTEKNVNKFPNRYYYAYGANYFVSLGLRL